jgi:hypothetical protein
MIHTIKIDDNTPTGKRLINELRRHSNVVVFENPSIAGAIPEGYMTGDEFFSGIKEELKKRSQENGLLQQNCSE